METVEFVQRDQRQLFQQVWTETLLEDPLHSRLHEVKTQRKYNSSHRKLNREEVLQRFNGNLLLKITRLIV